MVKKILNANCFRLQFFFLVIRSNKGIFKFYLSLISSSDLSLNSCSFFDAIKLNSFIFYPPDPTYMIRAIPSNASDNIYCTLVAPSAIHGAMAGYTGFTVGPVKSRHAYIPISVSFKAVNAFSFILNSNDLCLISNYIYLLKLKSFP